MGGYSEFFEGIEDFEARTPEVLIVARRDRKAVPSGGGGDVAVFDRHAVGPDVGHRHVESVDPALEGVDEPREPGLERLTLPFFFGSNPVRQLRDDNRAGVAAVLLDFEPGDYAGVAVSFRRLADDVGVEEPAHGVVFLTASCGGRARGGGAADRPG